MSPGGDRALTDLAQTLGRQQHQAAKTGLRLGSGTILTWDPATLTGTVRYQDTVLSDLPILSALDAFSWQPGDEVTLLGWHPVDGHRRAGFGSYFVLGRVFRPGAANSAKVLQALQNEFAAQISAEIFADRIHSVQDNDTGSTTSSSFENLTGANVGPVVADVEITETGRALVITTAHLGAATAGANSIVGAWMSYDISGATTRAASDFNAASTTNLNAPASPYNPRNRVSAVTLEDSLTPGRHTFTAVYRSEDPAGATFTIRNLTVIAF